MEVAIETLSSFLQLTETKTRKKTVNKKWILEFMGGFSRKRIFTILHTKFYPLNVKEKFGTQD
ncbi:hypothetical protein DQM68_11225 [Leptospira mayottensis]|nr:hypothetical protein DQM68_11225 [Leptospira mayottensis]AZQ02399.1 hypothetical protein LEP1GSC190_10480 [Leptospira mayottensis 200901116]TGN16879.1 hypothetical protein EHR03_03030 [Leptospira mayottensis]